MRFSKKTAHRIIISLAMAFPIVYLLGTQIATLAGAHGERLLADYVEDTYVRSGNLSQGWLNADGSFDSSFSDRLASPYIDLVSGSETVDFDLSISASGSPYVLTRLCFYDVDQTFLFGMSWNLREVDNISIYPNSRYVRLSTMQANAGTYDITFHYLTEDLSIVSYRQTLFMDMFGRENFITKIGENSISENPKGFAPFGSMLRYLDVNMLHAGDTQIGLMFYGMIYWVLHVILADLVYHLLVFIPNLIMRVSEWFGHGLDDDKGA